MTKSHPFAALFLAIAVVGCSPQQSPQTDATAKISDVHSESGLEVVPLTIAKQGGGFYNFAVEVAANPEEQAKGLMFRTKLGRDEGMIFPRRPPDFASFWMKNTPLPLDIIFVGIDGRIMNIAANTTPYSLESVSAAGMTGLVLELAGGRAAELGIKSGDTVEYALDGQLWPAP